MARAHRTAAPDRPRRAIGVTCADAPAAVSRYDRLSLAVSAGPMRSPPRRDRCARSSPTARSSPPTDRTAADVLIDGETIAAIGADLAAGRRRRADETIDATGKYVIPGGIDVHTHMELPFGGTFAKDTFETGTRAAAFGGTTTIVDFAVQSRGASLREGLDAWHAKAEGNAVTDYGFHMIMSDVNDDTLAEMDALVAEGVTDFKLFTAYPGVFYSDDGAIFRAMQQTARNGGLIMMHAENGMAIDVVAAQTVAAGTTDPIGHGLARKAIFEGEATNRVIRLAEAAGVPVYIVHLSAGRRSPRSAPRATAARRPSPRPAPSTCSCRSTTWATGSRAPSSCARRRSGPKDHWDDLWTGLVKDDLQLVVDRPLPVRLPRPEGARPRRLPEGPQRPARRRGPARPAARRRRRRRADHAGALGRDRLDGAGQALRDVPAEGRVAVGADADLVVYDPNRSARSRPRPTTWTSTTRATRAGGPGCAATSSCRAARSSSGTASSPGARATAGSSSGRRRTTPG